MTIRVGLLAPDFSAIANDGSAVRLSELLGKRVVLYFYPKDETPGCTQEAKEFSELKDAFAKLDVMVFGISKNTVQSHRNFKQKYGLDVTLLTDNNNHIARLYDIIKKKSMFGKSYTGITRATFLIDHDGFVVKMWHEVKVNGHAREVLKIADAIFGVHYNK